MFRSMKQWGTVAHHYATTLNPRKNLDLIRELQAATQHLKQLEAFAPLLSSPARLRDPQEADDLQAHFQAKEKAQKEIFTLEYELLAYTRSELKRTQTTTPQLQKMVEKPKHSANIAEQFEYWAAQSILNRYHHIVLVHARGLTAMDVITALKANGMRPVIAYQAIDAETPAVLSIAPEDRVLINDYNNIKETQDLVLKLKAERHFPVAFHPGIGFRSEDAEFAKFCEDHGVLFIGPNSDCLHIMADKGEVKHFAKSIGLKIPETYYTTSSDTLESMKQAAKTIGYPVMVKNPFGGGGKNNRLAENDEALANAVQSLSPQGQHKLIFEKYIESARHIEFQMLVSEHGALYLGARDCSLQKFFQKLFEKLLTDADLLKKAHPMGVQIGEALHAMGYRGPATIEFLVDKHGTFYFMEVNPRLQMERHVTETITDTHLAKLGLNAITGRVVNPKEFTDLQDRLNNITLSPGAYIRHVRLNAHNVGYNDGKLYYEGISGKVTRIVKPDNTDDARVQFAIQENTRLGHREEAIDTQFGYVLTRGATQKEADEKAIALLSQIKIEVDGVEQPCNFGFARFSLQYLVDHPEQPELIDTGDFLASQYIAHCEQQATLEAEAERRLRF